MGSELGWGSARWLFGSMWLTSLLQLLSWLPGLGWKVQEASFTFLVKCGSFTWPLLIQQSSLSIFMVDASKTNSGSHQTSWGLALEVTQYHFCICSIDKSPGQARFPWEKKWISSLDGWSSMYIQGIVGGHLWRLSCHLFQEVFLDVSRPLPYQKIAAIVLGLS